MQKRAVAMVCGHTVSVLTGGPGTGKTTVLSAVLHATLGSAVLMGAPTGKAANVMKTATGFASTTIHRMLDWSAEHEGFKHSRKDPLPANLVVIDEASMLDLPLANSLVQAVESGSRLLIVGDVDQLPSVGPGAVLRDLIASGAFPVVRLDRIYRQGAGSGIAHNAQRVLKGLLPSPAEDFIIVKGCDEEKAKRTVVHLVSDTLPSKFSFDPKSDIQVLVPRHKGPSGRVELNLALQEALNPATESMDYVVGEDRYRAGDRVMQLRNAPEVGIFNGETGVITRIVGEDIEVLYPGDRLVGYNKKNIEQLTLAYASTIHKSQGGEFQAVVVVLTASAGWMLNKNLLYTAITRARKLVVLVTDDGARGVEIAIAKSGSERVTRLSERLKAGLT
jgi:exodeoxyribonuclease V alpha subunit